MSRALPILDGRKFGCTRCAHCCMEPGFIYMKREEVDRIAEYLGISSADLKSRYKMKRERSTGEWYIDAMHGKGCPLLDGEKRCSVHPVKPIQCATFPFWEEMIADASVWESAKSFCPGLDAERGTLYTYAEIADIRAGRAGT